MRSIQKLWRFNIRVFVFWFHSIFCVVRRVWLFMIDFCVFYSSVLSLDIRFVGGFLFAAFKLLPNGLYGCVARLFIVTSICHNKIYGMTVWNIRPVLLGRIIRFDDTAQFFVAFCCLVWSVFSEYAGAADHRHHSLPPYTFTSARVPNKFIVFFTRSDWFIIPHTNTRSVIVADLDNLIAWFIAFGATEA